MDRISIRAALAAAALVLTQGLAAAALVAESEPNDNLAGAQFVNVLQSSVDIQGERSFASPSDDFFSFVVRRAGLISISSTSPDGAADSVMGLFDPLGNLVASNDDGGIGFMSAIDFMVTDAMLGTFTIGFTGFDPGLIACAGAVTQCYDSDGDFVFDTFVAGVGGGSMGWGYTISVSGDGLVSSPGSLALAALGLPLMALARRRTRRARRP
jgi:hypothetical protein